MGKKIDMPMSFVLLEIYVGNYKALVALCTLTEMTLLPTLIFALAKITICQRIMRGQKYHLCPMLLRRQIIIFGNVWCMGKNNIIATKDVASAKYTFCRHIMHVQKSISTHIFYLVWAETLPTDFCPRCLSRQKNVSRDFAHTFLKIY